MTISVAWATGVISVEKTDTVLIGTDPVSGREIRSFDTNAFRLALKALEDDEEGIVWPDTHIHNTEVVLSGTTFARTFESISPYSIEFEDGQYAIILSGSNNNVSDVAVVNQVSIRSTNSAGLVSAGGGCDLSPVLTAIDALPTAEENKNELLSTENFP